MTTPNVDHWIIVMEGVPPGFINTTSNVLSLGKKAAEWLGLTIVGEHAHYFGPGVSALVIISESHLSFHTWPEHDGWVYADIASCACDLDQQVIEDAYRNLFAPVSISIRRALPPDH